jgi:RNA polymerase sigma-70 factor (ECF subfamily)
LTPDSRGAEPTDVELVSAMARGDAGALGALYDRYAPTLLALSERIVGRGSEGEDLVQEVFLEAWRRSASYDAARASVKAWLLLRMRSRCLDHKKSARVSRRSQGSEGAWLEELAGADAEPSLAPDRAKIREVLLGLPAEQRVVLLLGYFEGLSSSEMAERLGIPIGTVKSRAAAALAALRAALTRTRSRP